MLKVHGTTREGPETSLNTCLPPGSSLQTERLVKAAGWNRTYKQGTTLLLGEGEGGLH